jgi:hypothetical protein
VLIVCSRAVVIGAAERDVAEALDAIGLAQLVTDLPKDLQRPLVIHPRADMVGERESDIAEASHARCLALHGTDLPKQFKGLFVVRLGIVVVGTI